MNDEKDTTIAITQNGPLLPLDEEFILVGIYPDVWLISGDRLVGQSVYYDNKGRLAFKNGRRVLKHE